MMGTEYKSYSVSR